MKKDNHTWTPAGWTPTTTSLRFQLVSQVARLDADGGCSRWGDRSFAPRRRSPYFAPVVVVVVNLAAPSQCAQRLRSSSRSLSPRSLSSAASTQVLTLCLRVFFLTFPALHRASLASRASLPLVALRPPLFPPVPAHETLIVSLAPLQCIP